MKFTYLLLSIIPAVFVSCAATSVKHGQTIVNSGAVLSKGEVALIEVIEPGGAIIRVVDAKHNSERVVNVAGVYLGAKELTKTTLGLSKDHVAVEGIHGRTAVRTLGLKEAGKTERLRILNPVPVEPPVVRFFRASQPTRAELMKQRRELFRREDAAVFYSVLP